MCDMSRETRAAISLASGSLVVGNQDSLMLCGASAQSKLRDCTNSISRIMLQDNREIESAISEILSELDQFHDEKSRRFPFFERKKKSDLKLRNQYQHILSYLDQVTLFLQLQQSQLLKEVKLLEKLEQSVRESGYELEACITQGLLLLQNQSLSSDSDFRTWYLRLQNKIGDLKISRTLALQSQAQIKLLHDNDLLLVDKISQAVSNTFSLWRTQITIQLGLDKIRKDSEFQSKMNKAAGQVPFPQKTLMPHKDAEISLDSEALRSLDSVLKAHLNEMALLESQDHQLRKKLQEDTVCAQEVHTG